MTSTTLDIYRRKIDEIASDYTKHGYKVLVEPKDQELPSFLGGFHPDLVAIGPQDSVVVEVKIGTETAASERFRELVETIQQQPGWRFSLVVVDPRTDEVAPSIQPLLDIPHITGRLREAEELYGQDMKDAAFIVLWLSIEAILRHLAIKENLPLERVPSSALFKELYSMGLISNQTLNICLRALTVRNAIVHGFESPGLDDVFKSLLTIVPELLEELNQQQE